MTSNDNGPGDRWEFYTDSKGEHRWRCVDRNGNIVASSAEGYSKKSFAVANAERHGYSGGLNIPVRLDHWEFYTDSKGEHRWRRRNGGGKIEGSADEGYSVSSRHRWLPTASPANISDNAAAIVSSAEAPSRTQAIEDAVKIISEQTPPIVVTLAAHAQIETRLLKELKLDAFPPDEITSWAGAELQRRQDASEIMRWKLGTFISAAVAIVVAVLGIVFAK